MASPEQALRWMVNILNRQQVSFQICGGLAARAYGASRELLDIDLYMPMQRFSNIQADIAPYIIWGPEHETGSHWDLVYLKIDYEGQRIEIGDSDNTHIYDEGAQTWVRQEIDFARSEMIEIYGVTVPVMPKAQLIAYKTMLSREVDEIDLKQIQ